MIDWLKLFYNSIWILGLAILLATFSQTHWQATQQQVPLRQSLKHPLFRLLVVAGFLLVAVGLMLVVEIWWHKVVWAGLILLSLWEGFIAWREWFGQTRRS